MSDSSKPLVRHVGDSVRFKEYDAIIAHYKDKGLDLIAKTVYNNAADPECNEPGGTRSIMDRLFDPETYQLVAMVHYLLRPDGTLGASGRKHPKRTIWNGVDSREPADVKNSRARRRRSRGKHR